MTVKEFLHASCIKEEEDVSYVIKVNEHETGPFGEARVVLIQELHEQFKIYLYRSRAEVTKMLNKSGKSVKHFFVTWT